MKYKLVDTDQIFVDSTHVKACANSKKMRKRVAHEQALWYEDELKKGTIESEDYVQKFSYETGQGKFDRTIKKVKKEINEE